MERAIFQDCLDSESRFYDVLPESISL